MINYLNREISLLKFNHRVIDESFNKHHPILERLRFLNIASNNVDEFLNTRLGRLLNLKKLKDKNKSIDGLTPEEQYVLIHKELEHIFFRQEQSFRVIRSELSRKSIQIVRIEDLSDQAILYVKNYFFEKTLPRIKENLIVIRKGDKAYKKLGEEKDYIVAHNSDELHLYPLSEEIKRFIPLTETDDSAQKFIAIENLIKNYPQNIFAKDFKDICFARFVRNGDVNFSDSEQIDLDEYEKIIKKRDKSQMLHVRLPHDVNLDLNNKILQFFDLQKEQRFSLRYVSTIPSSNEIYNFSYPETILDKKEIVFPEMQARFPERINDFDGNYFKAIDSKDILIHHPYESFDVVSEFIAQAASDDEVTEIKQTLYRTTIDSPIINALIKAKRSGKKVTCAIELKARFDEENNIKISRLFADEGIEVIHHVSDLKTHAKASFVKKETEVDGNKVTKVYAHFGTGNYHPITSKTYSDLSLFTGDKDLCGDAEKIFDLIKDINKPPKFKNVFVSPINLHSKLIELIYAEKKHAIAGRPANIWLKANSLLDKDIIDALYEAADSGVKIKLIIRGVCSLVPRKNIEVKSIIGRFLEHARIYCFGNGLPIGSANNSVYISSADLMKRNMQRRIELMVPIKNPTVYEQVLGQIIQANIADEKQSWILQQDGEYQRLGFDKDSFSAHDYFVSNPSLSGRGSAIHSVRYLESISRSIYTENNKSNLVAVIDIGSNSIRLVVYDSLKRVPLAILNEKKLCGLIRGIEEEGFLNEEAVNIAYKTLARYTRIIEAMKIKKLFCFATSAVREAKNGEEFVKDLKKKYNLSVKVLSGEEEARIASLGVISITHKAKGVVGDLGGGSLELAYINNKHDGKFFNKDKVISSDHTSLPIGSLRLSGLDKSDSEIYELIDKNLAKFDLEKYLTRQDFYAVGGGFRMLARIHMLFNDYPLNIVRAYRIDADKLSETLEKILLLKDDEIDEVAIISQKRLSTLRYVAMTMKRIIDIGKPKKIFFSTSGVREGILFDTLSPVIASQDPLISAVYYMISNITPSHIQKSNHKPWIEFGLELAALIDGIYKNEKSNIIRLRNAACILSWIAWYEHNVYRAEAAFRWILDSELPAINHKERVFIATCVYYRYKESSSKILDRTKEIIGKKWHKKAKIIGLTMRLGFKLSGGALNILPRTNIFLDDDKINVLLHPNDRGLISDEFMSVLKKLAKLLKLELFVR